MLLLVGPDTRKREGHADRFPMRRVRSFLCIEKILHCARCINKQNLLFDWAPLSFVLYLHYVSLTSSISENQNAAIFFKTRFLRKGWVIPYEKCLFLLDMVFLVKGITNLLLNFT
jgi:hypothetical protein